MKIKSLLIGSAAAIVAAPAAFAADVIIAEPEPVEYVEVCDVAGAGYFYIPGSRTCLQISGLVRHELSYRQGLSGQRVLANGEIVTDSVDQDGIQSLVRGELNIRTFTETELGDLTSFIRFRANDRNADPFAITGNAEDGELNVQGASINGSAFLNNAVIGLGGLELGLSDTLYDQGIAGEFDSFGGDRVHFIRYTADLGAFSASLAVEAERADYSQNDFVPNVVGKLSGDLGAFSVDLFAAYDDADDRFDVDPRVATAGGFVFNPVTGVIDPVLPLAARPGIAADDEFSLKAIAGADFGPAAIEIGATYNSGINYYSNGYEYSVGASAAFGLGEKAKVTFGGQYFANRLVAGQFLRDNAGLEQPFQADSFDGADGYTIGAVVDYEIVDGFDVKLAVNYADLDTVAAVEIDALTTEQGLVAVDNDGVFNGFLRFDRTF